MNSKADVIAISTERPIYPQAKSKWFGSKKGEKLKVVFSFYSPDGNEIAMPIACISAYLKRDFPWVEVSLLPILILRDADLYSPESYAKSIQESGADLIAFSVMSPHWYPMEPYFEEVKKLCPDLPVCIGGYQAMLSQEETIANPNVDYICVGDGEYATGNLVQHLLGTKDRPADGIWQKLIDGDASESDPHHIGFLPQVRLPVESVFSQNKGFT